MLALTRRKNESIIIGNNIEVIILGVQGEQVKLGIAAPRNITVHRKEIYDQIRSENRAASHSDGDLRDVYALLKNQKGNHKAE